MSLDIINFLMYIFIMSNITNPKHYNSHPSKIECIRITRHMPSNIANAIKYLWRMEHKNGIEDLKKSIWYIADEIDRLQGNSDDLEAWGERLKMSMRGLDD